MRCVFKSGFKKKNLCLRRETGILSAFSELAQKLQGIVYYKMLYYKMLSLITCRQQQQQQQSLKNSE